MSNNYNPQEIEPKWQEQWEKDGLYRATDGSNKPKYYCLDFFPYPSGEGLHVGHCRNYVPTDVISRFKRMKGYNVLHPMGWDAFGEPAEQHAIANGIHPRQTTDRNTANYKRQMRLIGTSYDWSREVDSSDPGYYRWTQWFFLLLYKRGLAYRDMNWQWWCPTCQTTLSSHEAAGGVCWRGHEGVTKREIPAWYFKITAYADELITGLDTVDWPERIRIMQRNWIGRSEGAEIQFSVVSEQSLNKEQIAVFTTRPDTIYGVTFFVLAPEHPLVERITTPDQREEVQAYIAQAMRQSEVDRMSESREKTGVFTGGYVENPLNGEHIPVWAADYVMMGYGTGAIMGVPAHDQRDFEFARKFGLPVRVVIAPEGSSIEGSEMTEAFPAEGKMVNSAPFNGLPSGEALQRICEHIESKDLGKRTVKYRMRDWLISRQRYWGAPIPIIHCPKCGEVPVPEDQLPVLLPPMEDFRPDGSGCSPLARLSAFVNTTCPTCGGAAQRETDTMGGFACSSWYFLRFTSPDFQQGPFDPARMNYWMPVDLYVGGAEHAVLHLLYARFWTKVMADAGLVPFREPFAKLMNQGQLMGPDGQRMSKSRGNTITPDAVVDTYGADSLRIYEMFMAPFDQDVNWSMEGINGTSRFLEKIWRLYADTWEQAGNQPQTKDDELERKMHQTIRGVTERIETFRLNTMVSTLMEFVNTLGDRQRDRTWKTSTYRQALETLMVILAPAAPHIVEELWQLTGHEGSVHQQAWPSWDADLAREEVIQVPVQVNGKLRDRVVVPADASEEDIKSAALASEAVQKFLDGKPPKKVIVAQKKLVNIVV